MKKILFAALALSALGTQVNAQTRMTLHEEFTGENCGPCASTNPDFWTLCNSGTNPSKLIHIAYMSPIPSSGWFYMRTKVLSDARLSYYSISSAPSGKYDGGIAAGSGHPASFTQTHIDTRAAVAAPFNMTVAAAWDPSYDSVDVTVNITSVTPVTGTQKLHIAMIQTWNFPTPPGSNGETHFENVVQEMYPSVSGTTLPTITGTHTVTLRGKVPNFVDKGAQPRIVAWIQDGSTKEVHQAAQSPVLPGVPLDIAATDVAMASNIMCAANGTTSFPHTVTIKNSGTTTLTSATIYTRVGTTGAWTSTPWSGSLASGATATVPMTASGTVSGAGYYTVYDSVAAPNGSADQSNGNNVWGKQVFVENNTALPLPYTTSFETTEQGKYYMTDANSNGARWGVYVSGTSTSMGHTGTYAAAYVNYGYPSGESEIITLPKAATTAVSEMTFWSCHAQQNTSNTDKLEVVYSTDCGATWTSHWNLTGTALASAPVTSGSLYIPVASTYVKRTVSLSAVPSGAMLGFRATNGGGNTIAIDDIDVHTTSNVNEVATANLNMNVFPNPATDKASVSFSLSATTEASVTVIDGVGRTVAVINNGKLNAGNHTFDIDTKNLTSGIYSVVVNADGGTFTQRLSVVK
jgi:hypothetical protein